MKKSRLRFLIGAVLTINVLFTSCSKENVFKDSENNSEYSIGKEKTASGNEDNEELEGPDVNPAIEAIKDFAEIKNVDVHSLPTSQQTVIGEEIISKSVQVLKQDYGFSNAELINIFGSIDNPNIGVVGLMLEAYKANENYSSGNPCESKIKVIRCLLSAAIPCTILTTAVNALTGRTTKMDAAWALGVINDMLRISVNYATPAGLALMAADFSICMLSPGDESGSGNGDSGSEYSNLIGFVITPERDPSLLYEFNSNGNYYFVNTKFVGSAEALSDLTSTSFQHLGNTIIYDSTDGKLYSNSSATTLASDGFYLDESLSGVGNDYKEFSYIKDGLPVFSARKYF